MSDQRDNIYSAVAILVIAGVVILYATVVTLRKQDAARGEALPALDAAPEGALASYSGPWMLFEDGSCVLPLSDAQWTGIATNSPERITRITNVTTSNVFWTLRMPNSRVFYVTQSEFERIEHEPGGVLREDLVWLMREGANAKP